MSTSAGWTPIAANSSSRSPPTRFSVANGPRPASINTVRSPSTRKQPTGRLARPVARDPLTPRGATGFQTERAVPGEQSKRAINQRRTGAGVWLGETWVGTSAPEVTTARRSQLVGEYRSQDRVLSSRHSPHLHRLIQLDGTAAA